MGIKRNQYGIEYLEISGPVFCEKMKVDRAWCDNCGEFIAKDEIVIVIPFLNSAYCKNCGEERLLTCRTVEDYEEVHKIKKEIEFRGIFR